jgi:hypothetical protein
VAVSASAPQSGSPPVPRTRLIGREEERRLARTLLFDEAVPLLTLTGPGGAGKTRPALAIASDVAGHQSCPVAHTGRAKTAGSPVSVATTRHLRSGSRGRRAGRLAIRLVVDTVGGETWERSWDVLRSGGRLV